MSAHVTSCCIGSLCLLSALPLHAQDPAVRRETERSLRALLFLDAALGLSYRRAAYAEDASAGPDGRGALRVAVRGSTRDLGPLSSYLSIGFVGQSPSPAAADPFSDPYRELSLGRSLRLNGVELGYTLRGARGARLLEVRGGRLAEVDARAALLLYDGGELALSLGPGGRLRAWVGRRALLDGGLPDGRTDPLAALVFGGAWRLEAETFAVEIGHRGEEVQRPFITAWVHPGPRWSARTAAALGLARGSAVAASLSADLEASSAGGETVVRVALSAELGDDPGGYGRGGRTPSLEELAAARTAGLGGSLDRVFLGSDGPELRGELVVEQALGASVSLHAELRGRRPLRALPELRPAWLELGLGPELVSEGGVRAWVELRAGLEDPGEASGAVFDGTGDGVRRRLALAAEAELPFRLGEEWRLGLRPAAELSFYDAQGPLSRADAQAGLLASGWALLHTPGRLRLAVRLASGWLPPVDAGGVPWVHELELLLGGTL